MRSNHEGVVIVLGEGMEILDRDFFSFVGALVAVSRHAISDHNRLKCIETSLSLRVFSRRQARFSRARRHTANLAVRISAEKY